MNKKVIVNDIRFEHNWSYERMITKIPVELPSDNPVMNMQIYFADGSDLSVAQRLNDAETKAINAIVLHAQERVLDELRESLTDPVERLSEGINKINKLL